jgi:hypothetical protein
MKRLIGFAAALAATTALAACGSKPAAGNNSAAPANTAAPANAAAPAANAAAAGNATAANSAHPTLTVNNRSSTPIVHFYIGPTSSDQWGDDLFTSGDPLAAGASTEIEFDRSDTECVWDVRVTVQGGANHELRNINLCTTHEIDYTE